MKYILIFSALLFTACASHMVEGDGNGGTVKYRKNGLMKDNRREGALSDADKHCEQAGHSTYQITKEFEDGRKQVIQFSCK